MTYSRLASSTFSFFFLVLGLLASVASPAEARRHRYINKHSVSTTSVVAPGFTVLRGRASWYGKEFQGSRTSSGERFNRFHYTCAHKTLPFGTRLRVTNVKTGVSVVVRVADRGPFRHQRIIDLAEVAARPLGIVESGSATVIAEVVEPSTPLGLTAAPANLPALAAADPDPSAAFATYPAPILAEMLASADSVAALAAAPAHLLPDAARAAHFELQAGSFADAQQATAMQARILALDQRLPVGLTTRVVAGQPVTNVVISELSSWLAAETVRRNLQLWGIVAQVRELPAEQPNPIVALTAMPVAN